MHPCLDLLPAVAGNAIESSAEAGHEQLAIGSWF
jgi:hypothetical protein